MTRLLAYGLAVFFLGLSRPAAEAATIAGVTFDPEVEFAGERFGLHGVGLFRYRVMFRAYVGALYIGKGHSVDDLWSPETPVRLELEYFWPIAGDRFGPAAVPFLKDNLSAEDFERIQSRADQLSGMYEDVRAGDRAALTFIPGRGTELTLNGKSLGMIEGDDFASAYLRIWLGERPIDDRFRDQILSGT